MCHISGSGRLKTQNSIAKPMELDPVEPSNQHLRAHPFKISIKRSSTKFEFPEHKIQNIDPLKRQSSNICVGILRQKSNAGSRKNVSFSKKNTVFSYHRDEPSGMVYYY